jgi:hypothetical protein
MYFYDAFKIIRSDPSLGMRRAGQGGGYFFFKMYKEELYRRDDANVEGICFQSIASFVGEDDWEVFCIQNELRFSFREALSAFTEGKMIKHESWSIWINNETVDYPSLNLKLSEVLEDKWQIIGD